MSWIARIKAALTPAPKRPPARRLDGWSNPSTGMGQLSYDRSLATAWGSDGVNLTCMPNVLTSLHRYNPLARRVVEKPVALALSKGLHWSLTGAPSPEAPQVLASEMARLRALTHLRRARVWGRLYGAGLLVAHTEDVAASGEPLPPSIRQVVALRAVPWSRVAWVSHAARGPSVGEPEIYYFYPQGGMAAAAVAVHHSRVWRFDGAEVDPDSYAQNGRVHDSVLNAPYRTMARVGAGEESLASQLDNATKGVWKIQGLHDAIAAGNGDFIRDWIRTVEMSWSTFRGAALDAEAESFEWLARPMKDSVEVYGALMHILAAAVDIPATELFGQTPGGLSTDDQSGTRKWYAKIDAEERAQALDPCLVWLTDLLARQTSAPALSGASIGWEWPSLWDQTAQEIAATRKLVAETDAIYLSAGVLLPGEVTHSRYGGARYSAETQLDEEARE